SSEYSKTIAAIVAGEPPAIDLAGERRLIDSLIAISSQGIAASAHDISDGGLVVALAEACFAARGLGANVSFSGDGPAEAALFGHSGPRCMVSVAADNVAAVRSVAAQYGVAADQLGQVTGDGSLRIQYKGHAIIASPVKKLHEIWANSLERILFTK